MAISIENPHDPRLADYAGMRERRHESDEFFIVESAIAVRRLLASAYAVRSVLCTPQQHAKLGDALTGIEAPVYVASREVLAEIAGFDLHRGIVASAARRDGPSLTDVLATATRLVVLEGSNDHENIGVIARTARGLGVDALVLDPTCADPFYRRSVRVSMGEILHLPIVRLADWPGAIETMHAAGFETWALTPDATAAPLDAMKVPDRLALLAGAEGPGLTTEALHLATWRVRIPLRHGVDSLNLGHALAIGMAATAPKDEANTP